MADSKKVPEIRFKKFNQDWEHCSLKDVVNEVNRKDALSNAPVMMIAAADGFIEQSARYSFDNSGDSLKKYVLLKKGELAYNHGASKLRPYGSCFALEKNEARVPFVYHCFSSNSTVPQFLSTLLNGKNIEKQLRQIVSSGARMDGLLNISFEEYSQVKLALPIYAEQKCISSYLSGLDWQISSCAAKLAKLDALKKSMLGKMFPKDGALVPEIRFKGFSGEWERKKLGDMCTISTGKLDANAATKNGEYAFFTCGKEMLLTNSYAFEGDAILISGNGDLGFTRRYSGKFNAYQRTYVLQNFDMRIELCEYAIHRYLPDRIIAESFGGAMPYIKLTTLSDLVLCVPVERAEIALVAHYFDRMNDLIELQTKKLTKLQNLKSALLDKMFVG